ncbi:MAG: non-homologous end-joining DNA ligase [Candidatus Baltobacteraceae bacterium]
MNDPFPRIHSPMLATLIDAPFDDDDWLFETKWDGFRALCTIAADGSVRLVSRNGKDFLERFPELGGLHASFHGHSLLLDGEIVALDRYQRSDFQRLQNAAQNNRALRYAVFDVLYARGKDLRERPLSERKQHLHELFIEGGPALFSEDVIGKGRALFARAKRRHLEGIVGKRLASTYQERRSRDWVKIKATFEQEFVIGGWSEPGGSRIGFGSLLLGAYDGRSLRYVGEVGSGFSEQILRDLHHLLREHERASAPFVDTPELGADIHWASPILIAEVRFSEWTRDRKLRHPVFLGLRDDKAARDVVFETPTQRVG